MFANLDCVGKSIIVDSLPLEDTVIVVVVDLAVCKRKRIGSTSLKIKYVYARSQYK